MRWIIWMEPFRSQDFALQTRKLRLKFLGKCFTEGNDLFIWNGVCFAKDANEHQGSFDNPTLSPIPPAPCIPTAESSTCLCNGISKCSDRMCRVVNAQFRSWSQKYPWTCSFTNSFSFISSTRVKQTPHHIPLCTERPVTTKHYLVLGPRFFFGLGVGSSFSVR